MDRERAIDLSPEIEVETRRLAECTVKAILEEAADLVENASEYTNRQRRDAVCSESYDPSTKSDSDEGKDIRFKTTQENKKIRNILKEEFIFRDLDEDVLDEVIDAMLPLEVKSGDTVIQEGDDGDYFYVIDHGSYDAFVKQYGSEECVTSYEDKGSFGELALMYDAPRAATVRAATDGFLWAIARRPFRKLILKRAYEKRQRYTKLMNSVPELKPLTEYEMAKVCDVLIPVSHSAGEVIVEEGSPGDGMYIIEEGSATVVRSAQKGAISVTWKLNAGQYFGEMTLIKSEPRNATVTAKVDCKLVYLDVKDFERVLGKRMKIMKRNMERYQPIYRQM